MDEEDYDALHVIRDVMATSRSFHQTIRFLGADSRNQLVALHERNTSLALSILRTWISQEHQTTMVMNIPIDMSGNFMEPVPVVPTREQITAATEIRTHTTDTQCAICQEDVTVATRIRHCGHCFHSGCIQQWFGMNPRCPVCRYDIRDFQPENVVNSNDSSMHPDDE